MSARTIAPATSDVSPNVLIAVAAVMGAVCGGLLLRAPLMGFGMLAAPAAGILAVRHPMACWQALVLLFMAVANHVGSPAMSAVMVGLFLVLIAAMWLESRSAVAARATPVLSPAFWCWAAALMVWGLISGLRGVDPMSSAKELTRYALSFVMLWAYTRWLDSAEKVDRAVRWWQGVSLFVAALFVVHGVLELCFGIREELLVGPYPPTRSDIAVSFAALLPLMVVRAADPSARRRWWAMASVVLLLIAAWASGSRATVIGGAGGAWLALWMVRPRWRAWLVTVPVIAGGLGVWLLQHRYQDLVLGLTHNLSGRPLLWAAALRAAREHPLLGVGPGGWITWVGEHYTSMDFILPDLRGNAFVLPPGMMGGEAHSLLFTKLAEMGWPAVGFILGLGIAWWRSARRALADATGRYRMLAVGAVAAMGSLAVRSLFENGPIIGRGRGGEILIVWFIATVPLVLSRLASAPDRRARHA
jgi:O-antigen ligase